MGAEAVLVQKNITLPSPMKPGGNFVTAVRSGSLLFLAGHGPVRDGSVKVAGKLGQDMSVEEGYQVARSVGLNLLASARAALGSLDQVRGVVKVLGMVNATPEFTEHPKVINGFSDLMSEVFGDAGKHARSAVGMGSLPGGMPVEIEVIFEVG
jgi:enamine deaminase RidA (YjgF/YER057c/UK114 family)